MLKLLDGKIIRDKIAGELKELIEKREQKPTLAILQVGERPDSAAFIRQKKIFAESCGALIFHKIFEETVTEEEIIHEIIKLNHDTKIHGILVQLPLPANINKHKIIETITPLKDVDGLTSINIQLLWEGKKAGQMPATTRGILSLLNYYEIPVEGKNIIVVGKSTLVGKPIALALLNAGATVTICHKQTQNLAAHTKKAEILIVAIGDREFITRDYVASHQIVIDIGINSVEAVEENGKKITGDVKFSDVSSKIAAISPVPGGVGPMTVASLFQNLFDAYIKLS